MRSRRETGMALATAVLVLMLVSTMIVGLAWLVMTDQKLGGNTLDRQRAFYGAEGGMEALTAGIENAFNSNPAITCNTITGPGGVTSNPPNQVDLPGIQFLNPDGSSGYQALFTCVAGTPASGFSTITTGSYAGLYAQATPFTLQVTARSTYNSEVKLQREIQTVAIPIFQFGMFSQTDLDFFAGPTFNFGGRVHTNGNLWLASGSTLTMSGKVTAAGELITANLENGFSTTGGQYNGVLDITNGSSFPNLLAQAATQSVQGNANWVGNLGAINEPAFSNVASGVYAGNIGVKETGVKALNLAIATPGFGQNGQSIDLIRRGLATDAQTFLQQRYFDMQGMGVRILLSDYGPSGTCTDSDVSSTAGVLPSLSANLANPQTPVDLAKLAWQATGPPAGNGNTTLPYSAPPAWLLNVGTSVFPLPVSGANAGAAYSNVNGYWVKQYYPTVTGCIKIDYQNNAGTWTDITPTILLLGYTGRNINPQTKATDTNTPSPTLVGLPGAQANGSGQTINAGVPNVGCNIDPSPNAVIRLARERDNPSWASGVGGCPVPPVALASQLGTDYWPNVLYDIREGMLRDSQGALNAAQIPVAGAMYYVELDIKNLIQCLTNAAICPGVAGSVTNATSTGYAIYFSDRRGDLPDPTPPASIGGANVRTGAFGYDDIVNPASANSCPNAALDTGEDPEGDYNSSGVDANPILRTFGNTLSPMPANLWRIGATLGTQVTANATSLVTAVLFANGNCPVSGNVNQWPYAVANATELRENPPIFFRRALKIVNGYALGAVANPLLVCGAGPCGLTIASENPVYIQGDYNNNPNTDGTFATPNADFHVAASVVADAVTLLSDNWNDVNSFAFPYGIGGAVGNGGRNVTVPTTYRLAIAAGKNVPFKQPAVGVVGNDFGTDGGAHNFLRYIENWSPTTLYYRGSIVSMYYSHQAYSTFKCCNLVYNPPLRGYNFDTDFQTPSKLPPLTPMLRDINTIGFTQMSLPTQ